jgi:hypothetical protein
MAARRLNRESVDGPGLAPAQGPMPTSRLGGETVGFVVRVSRNGENTVAMSTEERRNEDG